MFFFPHISSAACRYVIKRRASVRALSLEKLPYQLLQQLCPLSFILSLSKSQKKSCWVSLEDIFSWDTSPPSLSAFGARFPTTLPGDPPGAFRGTAGDKMTRLPLCSHLSKEPSECPPSSTCWRSGLFHRATPTATAFFPSPHLRCEQRCLPFLHPLSPLARLSSSSSPTPVIGWFLAVSLLLLSHSGASVVAVENRYPCLFFFVFTQIKIPMN